MADVIFAGTAKRQRLAAQVALTIDNSDGVLPIDYSEVAVRAHCSALVWFGVRHQWNSLPSSRYSGTTLRYRHGPGDASLLARSSLMRFSRHRPKIAVVSLKKRPACSSTAAQGEGAAQAGVDGRVPDEDRRFGGGAATPAGTARSPSGSSSPGRHHSCGRTRCPCPPPRRRPCPSPGPHQAQHVSETEVTRARERNAAEVGAMQANVAERHAADSTPWNLRVSLDSGKVSSPWRRGSVLLAQLAVERQRSLMNRDSDSYRSRRPEDIRERAKPSSPRRKRYMTRSGRSADRLDAAVAARETLEQSERSMERTIADLNRRLADHQEDDGAPHGSGGARRGRIEGLDGKLRGSPPLEKQPCGVFEVSGSA